MDRSSDELPSSKPMASFQIFCHTGSEVSTTPENMAREGSSSALGAAMARVARLRR